jgi:signal transduction histidine kinase
VDLTVTLHTMAGLGALAVGGGILLREPSRARNQSFALLCAALAVWNLGLVGFALAGSENYLAWRLVYLFGSCATAPLGLQFALVLAGVDRRRRRRALIPAYLLAALLWLAAATPLYETAWGWSLPGIAFLGGTLAAALVVLGRHAWRLPPGPERRALSLVFWGGIVAVVGGLSDFIPRTDLQMMRLGPPSILVLLVIVCAVIVRHRFLDVDVFLSRAVALIAGAALVGLVFFVVTRALGSGFIVLFFTSILVLAAAWPAGQLILTRARSLLNPEDPVAQALMEISRRLSRATAREEIREAVEGGRRLLAGDAKLEAYLRRPDEMEFRLLYRSHADEDRELGVATISATEPLVEWLERERRPVSAGYLARERHESPKRRGALAAAALDQLLELELRMVVPLVSGRRLAGWMGLGRGLGERYITAEVAAAFVAVGQQALASLERIEAVEAVRRKEALAAVGELAGGLAHEVRNPVAAIRGAAQALGPEATERQRAEMLEVIEEESDRLGRFVGEFLEYARPGSPRREMVDLAETARRSVRALETAGLGAEITLVVPAELPPVVADPDQIHRLFDNLIRNAGEAAGQQGRVRIEMRRTDGGRVALRIEDNGPGILPQEVSQLFQPFHSSKAGGTGLGLALVHRIVESHGGEIRVEGRPGIGAAFTVLLPEKGPDADEAASEERPR